EHDGAGAVDDGQASTGGAVDAGDVGGAVDVADAAAQDGFRAAEDEAVIDAAGREPIFAAAEMQHAASARAADDPAALPDHERHGTFLRARGSEAREGDQREQEGAKDG